MAKKKAYEVPEMAKKFVREYTMVVDGFEVVRGDTIKIVGQYGLKFRFDSLTTNIETGAVWVDCFELFRNSTSQFRAFKPELVKRIPQRGKRAKRVV
jgi:uncharacterized protein YqgV (UPF0045/DUF77 family)